MTEDGKGRGTGPRPEAVGGGGKNVWITKWGKEVPRGVDCETLWKNQLQM